MQDSTEDGADVQRVREAGVTEPCASCNGKCCSKFVVSVTGFDIARLKQAVGKGFGSFLTNRCAEEVVFSMEQPFFLFGLDGNLEERLLCLKKKKDGSCVFQNRDGRCGIHEKAPVVCRAYPFVLSEIGGGQEQIDYVDCFVCPRHWNKTEREAGRFEEIGKRLRYEFSKNGAIVRKWNATQARKNGASFEKFVSYLLRTAETEMKPKRKRSVSNRD